MSAAVALVYKAEIMPGDHCAELLSYFIVCPLIVLFAFYNPKARRNEGKGFSSFFGCYETILVGCVNSNNGCYFETVLVEIGER